MEMNFFDGLLMVIVVVASVAIVYYRARGGSVVGLKLPRVLGIVLTIILSLCAIALFIAKRLFGVLPAWLFHLSLADAMSVLALASYLDYRHKRAI